MKTIPLKTLGPAPEIDYASVLKEVIRRPLNPAQGASIDEMRQSIRVLDKLEAANGTLELEDADYQHLTQKLTQMPWNLIDRRIIQLIDDVTNAASSTEKLPGVSKSKQ